MKILLDECMPRRLPEQFGVGHDARHVRDLQWHSLQNGALLATAEGQFDVLLTVDKNMPYQQSLQSLSIAVVVLDIPNRQKETFERYYQLFFDRLGTIRPGSFNLVQDDALL